VAVIVEVEQAGFWLCVSALTIVSKVTEIKPVKIAVEGDL
jgi:hypothetical protein